MNEFLHNPGFFGTNVYFVADFTVLNMLLAAALFSLGFGMARRQCYETQRWIQTGAASLNAIMILWMMILPFRGFIIQDKGGPRPNYFYTITGLHALLGFIALLFGIFGVLRGNRLVPKALRFKNYKLFMRTSYGLFMLATLLGVLIYMAWFAFCQTLQLIEFSIYNLNRSHYMGLENLEPCREESHSNFCYNP